MIRLLSDSECNVLDLLDSADPFAIRIKSLYGAYGADCGFIFFYILEQEAKTKAVLCRMGSKVTASAIDEFDTDELYEFCRFFGCELETAKKQDNIYRDINRNEHGIIICFDGTRKSEIGNEISIREAYDLLTDADSPAIDMPPFDDFYVDMSHRIRHGRGKIYGKRNGNTALAAAVISDITDEASVLSGITVKKEYRGHGLGQSLMLYTLSQENAANRKVYLLCKEDTLGFYEKCGGKICGFFERLDF